MPTKVCSKCKKEKDVSQFGKKKSKKDGYNCYCKPCAYDNAKTRYKNGVEIEEKILQNNPSATKVCIRCGEEKNISFFHKTRSVCAECSNSKNRIRVREQKNLEKLMRETGSLTMKTCSKCNVEKDIVHFYLTSSWCKECENESDKTRRYRRVDKEKKLMETHPSVKRICNKCKKEKPLNAFSPGILNCKSCCCKRSKTNYKSRIKIEKKLRKTDPSSTLICRICMKEKPLIAFSTGQAQCKQCDKLFYDKNWIAGSLRRHKADGIDIRTTQEELTESKDIDHCGICGKSVQCGVGKQKHNSPHLDRINNEDYMDIHNTQITCATCNRMKGEGSMDDFLKRLYMVYKTDFIITKFDQNITTHRGSKGRRWAYITWRRHIGKGYNIVATTDEIHNIYAQTMVCPICNRKLEHGKVKHHSLSPTLDRIENIGKGEPISIDDLWIICYSCNNFKQTIPFSKLKSYAELVLTLWGWLPEVCQDQQVKLTATV